MSPNTKTASMVLLVAGVMIGSVITRNLGQAADAKDNVPLGRKAAAIVDGQYKLPKVIDMVIEAVSAGELDKVLKAALGERRVKLRQVS